MRRTHVPIAYWRQDARAAGHDALFLRTGMIYLASADNTSSNQLLDLGADTWVLHVILQGCGV